MTVSVLKDLFFLPLQAQLSLLICLGSPPLPETNNATVWIWYLELPLSRSANLSHWQKIDIDLWHKAEMTFQFPYPLTTTPSKAAKNAAEGHLGLRWHVACNQTMQIADELCQPATVHVKTANKKKQGVWWPWDMHVVGDVSLTLGFQLRRNKFCSDLDKIRYIFDCSFLTERVFEKKRLDVKR